MDYQDEFKKLHEACSEALTSMHALADATEGSGENYFEQIHQQNKVSSALFDVDLNLHILQSKLSDAKRAFVHHDSTDAWLFFQAALRNDIFRWKEMRHKDEKLAQLSEAQAALEDLYRELNQRLANAENLIEE